MEGHGSGNGAEHWMALEGGADSPPGGGPYTSRFVGIGASVPEQRLTSAELMASTAHRTHIDLERLTGIHEHRVVAEGEDSYTLALAAAQDALSHTDFGAEDLDLLIVCSITRYVGGLRMQLEPPLSLSLKETLGARRRAELRHLQRLRRDDDRRFHRQRPDPTGPDPARHGRQRRVHLAAGRQRRP